MANLNVKKIEKQLERLYADKKAFEEKKREVNKDLDEKIRVTDAQIKAFEKVKTETEKLIRSAEEQMRIAEEMMSQGKRRDADDKDTDSGFGE